MAPHSGVFRGIDPRTDAGCKAAQRSEWPREGYKLPANRHLFAVRVSTGVCTQLHESHVSHAGPLEHGDTVGLLGGRGRHLRRHRAPRTMPQLGRYTWHPMRAEKKSRLAVVAKTAAGTPSRWSSSASLLAAR